MPEEYIAKMVEIFREVWRVLRDDGTLWLNMGDSYVPSGNFPTHRGERASRDQSAMLFDRSVLSAPSLKPKDLCMMPARVAMALQADGWYLRSDIIWHKPNPMPESVTDRPTKAHEYVFLLSKSERYFYDADAIKERAAWNPDSTKFPDGWDTGNGAHGSFHRNGREKGQRRESAKRGEFNGKTETMADDGCNAFRAVVDYRNKRTVWTIATQPYVEAHFATFPKELPKLCILAGSKLGDVVLDPFAGSGTTGKVAIELGRRAILIELNPAYIELARDRTYTTPGFL
jgi:DNA modification methylase